MNSGFRGSFVQNSLHYSSLPHGHWTRELGDGEDKAETFSSQALGRYQVYIGLLIRDNYQPTLSAVSLQ